MSTYTAIAYKRTQNVSVRDICMRGVWYRTGAGVYCAPALVRFSVSVINRERSRAQCVFHACRSALSCSMVPKQVDLLMLSGFLFSSFSCQPHTRPHVNDKQKSSPLREQAPRTSSCASSDVDLLYLASLQCGPCSSPSFTYGKACNCLLWSFASTWILNIE